LVALRFKNWKTVFMEQRCQGTLRLWMDHSRSCAVPNFLTFEPTH
jgi:arylsulfatase